MPIEKVNGTNTFQANNVKNSDSQKPENTSAPQEDKKLSKSAKYMIGATALAATVAVGIIAHRHNLLNKEIKLFKGKAILGNGKPYTGVMTKKTPKGNDLVFEYENGVLQKSTKKNGDKLLSSNEFSYYPDGKIKEVKSYSLNNYDKKLKRQIQYTPNGGSQVTNAEGKLISEVIVKADVALPYDADMCRINIRDARHIDYTYIKDGKRIIKEESTKIPYSAYVEEITIKNIQTSKIIGTKRINRDGTYDVTKSPFFPNRYSPGEIEHKNAEGVTTGFTEIIKTGSDYFPGPNPNSHRDSRWEYYYKKNEYDAQHNLKDTEKYKKVDRWESYDEKYF